MTPQHGFVGLAVLAGWLTLCPGSAQADVVRFHFNPGEICGPPPATSVHVVGEWQPWRGSSRKEPYPCDFRPNQFVTFHHVYTGQNVTVPLRLPPDLPNVQHVRDRIVFNYGSYSVEVQFFADGSVDTIYNSRLGRPVFYNG